MGGVKTGLEKELKVRNTGIFLVHEVIQHFKSIIQCCGNGKMIEEVERK